MAAEPQKSIVLFETDEPDLSLKHELVITNAIGKWPSAKVFDRLFIEVESLDENHGEVLKIFTKSPMKDTGKIAASTQRWIDLPDCGRSAVVMGQGTIIGDVDASNITGIHFTLEKDVSRRFGVRRVMFLSKGEVVPEVDEAPWRNRKDEKEHAESLSKFRGECGTNGLAVGILSSMESLRPRAGFSVKAPANVELRMAQNEYESFQIAVTSVEGDLTDATVEFSPLKSDNGVFSADNFECSPVGYVNIRTVAQYIVRPAMKNPARGWWPDAILDFTNRTDIAEGDVQSFWIRVKCPKGQIAGVYSGEVTVKARQGDKSLSRIIPLTVRINGFALPDKSMLPLAVSFKVGCAAGGEVAKRRMGNTNGIHNAWRSRKHEYGQFLAKYLLTWDMLYANDQYEPHWEVLKELKDEGRLGRFNLRYMWYAGLGESGEKRWYDVSYPKLRARYDRAKELGIADHAYLYGFDEVGSKVSTNVAKTVELLHREFPDVKVMTTARDGKLGVDGSVLTNMDIFCPATCFWNPKQAEKSRAAGHEVWWYFCNAPSYPFANTMIETPPIEIRSFMGAQSVKFRPDGFLYYAIASWNGDNPIMQTFYDWQASSFTTRFFYHGDGQWTCCGGPDMLPLPTLRLENFRDGLEDYAYAKILEEKLAKCADKDSEWAVNVREALAVPKSLVESLSRFSIDPKELYSWRNRLADLIEQDQIGRDRD